MLVDAAVQQRDRVGIEKYARPLEKGAGDLDHKLYLAIAHRARGVLHRLRSEQEEAETRLQEAADIFRGLDTRWQLGRTYLELGELAGERSEAAEAKGHYSTALTLFEEMGAVPYAGRARASLSKLVA